MKRLPFIVLAIFSLLILHIQSSAQDTLHFLALGDSYTIGESVSLEESWPHQLSGALSQALGVHVDVEIIAQTGWRTDELIEATTNAEHGKTYDFVTLLIGVNNQYQNKPFAQFESEYTRLLDIAGELTGGDSSRLFAVSIPDYGYSPYGHSTGDQLKISDEIQAYNLFIRKTCSRKGITFIDITPLSETNRRDRYADDGLHPSGIQYEVWVTEIKNQVLHHLKAQE